MPHMMRALAFAVGLSLASLPALAQPGDAFQPRNSGTVNIAAGVSSGTVSAVLSGQVRIYNSGSVAVFIKFCPGACSASTTADVPIAPGSVEVFTATGDRVAAITASGTAALYVTPGVGL